MQSSTHTTSRITAKRCAVALLAAITAQNAHAASQTWTGGADSDWINGANWSGGAAPGALSGLSTDVATFNSALVSGRGGAGAPVVIDSGRRVGGLSFAAGAGAYVIGSNGGNTLTLGTRGPGYIGGSSTVLAAGLASSQIIAAPIAFVQPSSTNGQHGFVNNATDSNVTLTLSGPITVSTVRPVVMVLDGSNTGNNTISGNISFTGATQSTPLIIKRGNSTWILSGTNTLSGTPATSTNSNYGVQVLDGVLSLQNDQALGSVAQVWVGNKATSYIQNSTFSTGYTSTVGGTLEVANNISLNNGLTLNLVNGGTLRSNGTNAVNSVVKISADAGVAASISTVGAGDVFTVGNADNDLTGGASDSLINVSGLGTLRLAHASNYVGAWSVNAGTLQAVNTTGSATGAGAVTVGASGTLAGTGVISGATTVNGALRPNAAPVDATSRLTFSSTLGLAGTTTFDIDGANYTGVTLSAADSLAFGGTLDFNFVNGVSVGVYDLFDFTDADTGSFAEVNVTSIGALSFGSGLWTGTYAGNSYEFSELTGDLTVTAVPEPSAFAAIAGLLGLGFAASRRRRAA